MMESDPGTPGQPEYAEPTPVTPPVRADSEPRPRRGALWFGVVLVFVGTLLLLSQLVPGLGLWRLWPLIIVAVGVRQLFGPAHGGWTVRHLGEGLATIAFGLVLLGQMLGILAWDVWLNILRLWPLLLVALGLEVIGKGMRAEWPRALGSLVIVAGLAYGALVLSPTAGWSGLAITSLGGTPFEFEEPRVSRVDQGVATVNGAFGVLAVEAGDELVTAEGASPFEPEFAADVTGDTAEVDVGLKGSVVMPGHVESRLDVTLDRRVIWDLTVDAGVSSFDVDLSEMAVRELSLDAGVSEGTLTLGMAADSGVPVEVRAGVSALVIRVPRGESARVVIGEGLSGVESRGEWSTRREDGQRVYESDGFDDHGTYWEIDVEAGIGGITIEYY